MPTTKQEFQHTAARRRLACGTLNCTMIILFQHTAARRRLVVQREIERLNKEFQHTAARRRLARAFKDNIYFSDVSTHSRPKAAGTYLCRRQRPRHGFNTQPPEGGWFSRRICRYRYAWFQHTAARRRLVKPGDTLIKSQLVSTHSRPKAAGSIAKIASRRSRVSTHSRPKAAGLFRLPLLN